MKVDRNLIRNLARTADILNTINGGMSQTTIKIHNSEQEWLIKVKTPGVDLDNLRLEVLDNHLYIQQMMEIDQNSSEKAPYVISMIPLIRQINIDAISATFEDGWTVIKLPFDEMVNGQERQIKIERR